MFNVAFVEASTFIEHFVRENGLSESGFGEWVLYPGMLFKALTMWWGDRGRRPAPHEGLDLCFYRDGQGRVHSLDENTRIPVLYEGVIAGIVGDFLGESLIVKHTASDPDTTEFCTIYGHTVPRSDLCVGRAVRQGETMATVADAGRSGSGVSPHLHISMGLASGAVSYGELDWGAIADPEIMTLVDPLSFIDRYCLVSDAV